MEGTAGVSVWRQCDHTNTTEYPLYRRFMSQEVAAAIQGARDAGPADVIVNDSHGSMVNLLFDELPVDVRVISGSRKRGSMTEGLANGFDAAIFTGYHAKAGHADGVLAHTYVGNAIFNVAINGIACSETLINAAMAGYFGIPVVMVSGDRALIDEVKTQLPWAVGVAVKDGIGNFSCETLTPGAAQEALRRGAARAVAAIPDAKPFVFDPPITLEITTMQIEQADYIAMVPGVERVDGRTLRFRHDDYLAVYGMFVTSCRLASAANAPA